MSEEEQAHSLPDKSNDDKIIQEDEELSKILDSALEDFTKQRISDEKGHSSENESSKKTRPIPPDILWDDEFLRNSARFEQSMQSLFNSGDTPLTAEQLGENIQRLAEAATQVVGSEASPDLEFSNIIAQTLKNLSENAENIQGNFNDGEFSNFLGALSSFADPNSDSSELIPVFLQMMQGLLSKDVLYPPLASVIEKYPQWLENNKSHLTSHEYEQYSEQLRLMKEILSDLEKEKSDDSSEEKNARFNRVFQLMKQMQDHGQLPQELFDDLSMDGQMNSLIPPNTLPNQCSLM